MIPERAKKGNTGLSQGLKTLVLMAIVVLVGVASFGLGRLSAQGEGQKGLIIHQPGEAN